MSSILTDYSVLFLIISIGILIGKIKIKGISLDSSAVIFVALMFGHFGFNVPKVFQTVGLLFFIYSIGIQSGPGFFESFHKKGQQLVIMAALAVITGAITTAVAVYILKIDFKLGVGLFAGAMTSTPGLAAAIESSKSPLASIGYGIAYPFGVIGVILFIRLSPKLFRVNLKGEERKYNEEVSQDFPEIFSKNFLVENNNIIGQTIGQLEIRSMTGANISRIVHESVAVVPQKDSILQKGDMVKAVGTEQALQKMRLLIGSETDQEVPRSGQFDIQWILVTNRKVVNKTLGQLNIFQNFSATITRIRRSGIDISPTPGSSIRFGDKLMVASTKGNMPAVIDLFGNNVKRLNETDFLPVAAGIVLGILIGLIPIPIPGGSEFKLGLTGGVLISGLVLSRIGKTGPIIWNISGPANQLLRQLGLLFFLAAVGTSAGETLVDTMATYGIKLFWIGASITLLPMILATIIGRYIFKLNFLSILGSLTGGMTSTPGLSAVDPMSDSNAPSIAYATVYPFAMVILIICAQILAVL
ncbi:aspartate:alanine exchanger family transporter [Bacteroidota bacterium]